MGLCMESVKQKAKADILHTASRMHGTRVPAHLSLPDVGTPQNVMAHKMNPSSKKNSSPILPIK